MSKYFILLLMTGLINLNANAQNFNIQGRLTDEAGSGLPSATILLLSARDSVMVNYALSNADGLFEVRNVRRGDYLIRFSYMGFATITLPISNPEGNQLNLGQVKLPEESKVLREVTVEQQRIPVRVKNDTIEYDALAFRPLPNEMVEDLLKRMPGMVVAGDGTIEAQGEQVRRVLVDGKEFFGRDPKMATQNIPADAISRVHVFDQRSEQSLFSGIDDGQRERTLNLELKDDRKEASFGNTSLGYGPDSKFQGRLNLNRFNSKGQTSVLAMGNNVNQQGFSVGDYMNFTGNTQRMAGGRGGGGFNMGGGMVPVNFDGRASSNGLMTSWAGGVNMNRNITSNTELTASYFYNQLDHDMRQDLNRQNFLPSGNYDFEQNLVQDNQNYNHRLNMRLDHKFSEKSSLLFTGNSSLNLARSLVHTSGQTLNTAGEQQNASLQTNTSEGQKIDGNANLLWRQRLNKPGRTITANFDFRGGNNSDEAYLNAYNQYFQQESIEEFLLQDQIRTDNNLSLSSGFTYTEPLGRRFFLETNYRTLYQNSDIDQLVYDVEAEGLAGELNNRLSNQYRNIYTYHQGGWNLLVNRDKFNFTAGASVQATDLKGEIISLDQQINRDYLNFLPAARFNYNFSNFRRFMVNYETSVREPSAIQIQPVVDNRDPLNIYEGNPDLRPAYRHRWQMRYNSFNPVNSFGYFAFVNAEYTSNAISNAVWVDENLVRRTSPVNTGNNLNLRTSFNVNFALNKIKSRVMIGANVNRTESVNVLNDVSQDIVNNTLGSNIRYIFRPVDAIELRLSANLNNQITRYEFRNTEQAYLNQAYQADLNWSFLKHYRLQSGYNYNIYQGRTSEFDRKIPMLDMSFSRSFLKNNSGELKFSIFNLLDSELGVTQTNDVNYYQRAVTNSLGRYFMLSFTYALNRQLNLMERGGGGGRHMIMH
jgi:hypothetical protein